MTIDQATRDRLEELRQPQAVENHMSRLFDEAIDLYNYQSGASKGRIHTNHASAIFRYINKRLFTKPTNPSQPNDNQPPTNRGKSLLLYEEYVDILERVLYAYIDLCSQWDVLPSVQGFATLTGISKQVFYNWDTGVNAGADEVLSRKRVDVVKTIREGSQGAIVGALYADTMGRITLANNERSIGLNYTAHNTILAGEVQRSLGSADLPRLE